MTTGNPVGLKTSTFTIAFSFVELAFTDVIEIVDVSFLGIKSPDAGVQVPLASARKSSCDPRKTLRSSLFPGTPYFGAMPHDVYCQITPLGRAVR